jgi:hypothetical protein
VPGPQFPLYLMGRELVDLFPMVPLAPGQAIGIAIMSYNGRINFGLVGDYDVLYDLDEVAEDFDDAFGDLARAGGVTRSAKRRRRARFAPATAPAGVAKGEGNDTVS